MGKNSSRLQASATSTTQQTFRIDHQCNQNQAMLLKTLEYKHTDQQRKFRPTAANDEITLLPWCFALQHASGMICCQSTSVLWCHVHLVLWEAMAGWFSSPCRTSTDCKAPQYRNRHCLDSVLCALLPVETLMSDFALGRQFQNLLQF